MGTNVRAIFTCTMVAFLATTLATAGVDLRASSLSLERTARGDLEVRGTYGISRDGGQGSFQVHVELRHLRNGQVIGVLWSDTHGGNVDGSSTCQSGCQIQSCTGTCWVDGRKGSCNVFVENCDGVDGKRECLCEIAAGPSLVAEVLPGDIFELSVEPIGTTDPDPSDNTLRVTYH